MREKIKIEELIKKLEISKSHLYRSLDKKNTTISQNKRDKYFWIKLKL